MGWGGRRRGRGGTRRFKERVAVGREDGREYA